MDPLTIIGMAGKAAQGVAGIIGGIVGSQAMKDEQETAASQFDKRMRSYESFDFQNLYADIENPMEDLRVGTQAAEFQAQQTQQGLAQTLDALRSSGGGAGAAALAQTLAQAQAQSNQQIASGIEQQELANESARAAMQAELNLKEASGAMEVQDFELGRTETLLDMSSQRKQAADAARTKATESILSGVGQLSGSVAAFGAMGGFKDGIKKYDEGEVAKKQGD